MDVVRIGVAGANGAFGTKHLEALSNIENVEVVAVMATTMAKANMVADTFCVPNRFDSYEEMLDLTNLDAVILATPTQIHAKQGLKAMDAGKHIFIEIPMSDSLNDAKALVQKQAETGVVAMAGHVRRFNPSHQWIQNKIVSGDLNIQQMDIQTYFFRRTNMNAKGEPRSWTDHLLWHHACHSIDLFRYQAREEIIEVHAIQGPIHENLKIAMDMSILMKTESSKICTLSLSFNNEGPLGSYFRYICDKGTYTASYDDLFDGYGNQIDVSNVDVSMNGIELIDREFVSSILEGREPNSSLRQCLPAMELMHKIERKII